LFLKFLDVLGGSFSFGFYYCISWRLGG